MRDILQDFKEKIKSVLADRDTFTALLLVLLAGASFGLGRQSVPVEEVAVQSATVVNSTEGKAVVPQKAIEAPKPVQTEGSYYVASKNGEVYHLPYCSGAKRISEKNKVTFKTKAEAEAAGLRPAANCPGI